jgi:hypothetical protein
VSRPSWHGEAPYVSGRRSLVRGAVLLTLAAKGAVLITAYIGHDDPKVHFENHVIPKLAAARDRTNQQTGVNEPDETRPRSGRPMSGCQGHARRVTPRR